jgi:polyferredoxin
VTVAGSGGARGAPDLLQVRGLGRLLRWRHTRSLLQALLLILAAVILLDGLFGPQIAPRNLAGILPWVHWRGFVVLALLVAGNLFCLACPFMLPRRLAKRFFPASRRWPAPLRSKWFAVGLLLLFFWAYEAFSLWASPWLTAWVILAYFALAFAVDAVFRGASFCKHVCPIGQFNFVNSMVSPTEVAVRDPEVCGSCVTKDCIRGRYASEAEPDPDGVDLVRALRHRPGADGGRGAPGRAGGSVGLLQSGCELGLYQPRKVGNLECTFCLECIHACPHDKVGIFVRSPIHELTRDPVRSGIGKLSRRPDLAALAALLVFGAYFNAFGMVEPVFALRDWMVGPLGIGSEPLALVLLFSLGLVLAPGLLLFATAAWSRSLSGGREPLVERISTYVWALVPLGLGMWTAHYLYHLLIGGFTILPVMQEYLSDLGLASGGAPRWGMGAMVPEGWLLPVGVACLQLGLVWTLVAAFRIARRTEAERAVAGRAFLPWATLATTLTLVGIWLLLQPMEMRGTFQAL